MSKDVLIDRASSVATYGGGAGAVIGGLNASEIGIYAGIIIGVIGLIINVWFKQQHLKLAREAVSNGRAQVVIDGDASDD